MVYINIGKSTVDESCAALIVLTNVSEEIGILSSICDGLPDGVENPQHDAALPSPSCFLNHKPGTGVALVSEISS